MTLRTIYYPNRPKDLVDNFSFGMDRLVYDFWPIEDHYTLVNLGAGRKHWDGENVLDAPDWYAGTPMPLEDESVDAIIAYHFFEHLEKWDLIHTLQECQRVLKPRSFINVVVPHWDSEAAHQDIDHKTFFSESTWKNLFDNPYYDGNMPRSWLLYERQSMIMGLVQRNLVVVSQLAKRHPED